MKKMILLLAIVALLTTASAFCANLSLVGEANYSSPVQAGAGYSAKPSTGFGALLEGRIAPGLGLEIGALSAPRKYQDSNDQHEYTQNMIEVPLLLRAHLGPFLSMGFGGYYASYTGDFKDKLVSTGITSNYTYLGKKRSQNDYGLVTSLGIYFPIIPGIKILLDGRYTIGTKNNERDPLIKNSLKYNDLQLLAGLRIGF